VSGVCDEKRKGKKQEGRRAQRYGSAVGKNERLVLVALIVGRPSAPHDNESQSLEGGTTQELGFRIDSALAGRSRRLYRKKLERTATQRACGVLGVGRRDQESRGKIGLRRLGPVE